MGNGWTAERRARQAEAIHRWRPWEQSTGPRTTKGKACASRNADKGGKRERLRSEMRRLRFYLKACDDALEALS